MQQPLALDDATDVPQHKGHSIALGKGLRLAFENPRAGRALLYRGDFAIKTADLGDKVARKLFITEVMELGANQSRNAMPAGEQGAAGSGAAGRGPGDHLNAENRGLSPVV